MHYINSLQNNTNIPYNIYDIGHDGRSYTLPIGVHCTHVTCMCTT